jgi:hypothetical protein
VVAAEGVQPPLQVRWPGRAHPPAVDDLGTAPRNGAAHAGAGEEGEEAMRGTWQTTDSGSGWKAALLAICAVLLLGSGGAVAAVSEALIGALLAVAAVTVLSVVALAVFLVHRARNPSPEGFVRTAAVRMPVAQQLPGERPAIEQAGPRELHNHYHFYGTDPTSVAAEILRRSQRPEQ